MADLTPDIETAAAQPKVVSVDGLRTEEHSLQDQIAADKYLKEDAAADAIANGKLPVQLFKFKPPGAV